MPSATLDVLRVFVSTPGRGGNPLGVFVDASAFDEADYQPIATELGFSETVFVLHRDEARLRIFTPALELPLAGHPLVGTSWLLHRDGPPPEVLRPPAGDVPTWQSEGWTWIRARPADAPVFDLVELASVADVEALRAAPDGGGHTVAWAWQDERAGALRARAFLPDFGISEDEATGAAALRLCAHVGRPIDIHQGRASLLRARPAAADTVELGGRVESVERRRFDR